jgi:integrase/recombinase XerC
MRVPTAIISEYTRYLQVEKGLTAATCDSYQRIVRAFLGLCAARPEALFLPPEWSLAQLDKRALEVYLGHLAGEQGRSPSAVARHATGLRSFFQFLQLRGHIGRNPLRSLQPRRATGEPALPDGTVEAVAQLFAEPGSALADARLQALLELLYGLALRPGQVYGIRRLELPKGGRQVRIETAETTLELPVSHAGRKRLAAWLAQRRRVVGRAARAPFWVGDNGRGLSPGRLARAVRLAMERVGLQGSAGTLRQLAVRHFLEQGGDVRSARELLRAKRLGSLDRYDPPRVQDVIATFRMAHPRQRGA